jgi:hypothetical protein
MHNKYRIPRATHAALLLSGAAYGGCSDDSTDTSSARIHDVGEAMCEQLERCAPVDFAEEYDSQAECIEEFEDGAEEANEKCVDAVLDFYSCITKLSCGELDGDEEHCEDQYDDVEKHCEDDDDDFSVGGSSIKRLKRAHALIRKYRIPR